MSTDDQNVGKGRIFGVREQLAAEPEVKSWTPPAQAEVDAMPPLPGPRPGKTDVEEETLPPPPPALELPEGIEADSTHAYIFYHPRQAAAVVRTIIRSEEGGGDEGLLEGWPARQVVAAFMIGLGQEVGARVVQHLEGDEIEYLAQSISLFSEVSHGAAMHMLERVRQRVVEGDYVEVGGTGYARLLLEAALGPGRAGYIVDRALYQHTSGFEMLKNVAPDQIAPFISNEHPQTIGLILSQLDPAQAAGILAQLPERMQADVAYRVATMENIEPNVIKIIEASLEESLRAMLGGNQDVGGPKVVADMLNLTGSSVEKNVLDQMDGQDPEVAGSVRNLIFVFDDISRLTDREIQTLMREVDQKDLVVALKASTDELKDKILGNMSERVRTFITEEMEFQGPMRLSEVEEVQLRIVQQVRQLEEQGQITIVRGDSEDSFV